MALDLERIRRQTPAVAQLIHFNNAGASLSPDVVTDAVLAHLQLEQRIGAYEAAAAAEADIENFYTAFATFLNCQRAEIGWAENATHAWNSVFHAVALQPGDRIVTGQSEYASNYLALLHLARQRQVHIDVVPNATNGQICLERLERALNGNVRLLALTHVPSQSGVVHPAAEAGRLARAHGILYLLDACQSAGQLALDVRTLGCDMLTGTGRKYLRGPRGTGFLYVRAASLQALTPEWVDMHAAQFTGAHSYRLRDDARRFENWECFVAGKIGLGVAVDYANAIGMDGIEQRVRTLAAYLRDCLTDLPGISVHETGPALSGIVTFSSAAEPAEPLQKRLQAQQINTSVVRLRNNLLDLGQRGLGDLNRASVHYYNTEDEIHRFCAAVARH
jgi:cysteine desulfurase/selenocysteine lyase